MSWLAALLLAQAPAAAPSAQWVTLGTGGGPVVQVKRAQPANALVVGDAIYLFDVGEGTGRALKAAGLPLARVRAVFLSHHHLDHVGGLGPLVVNRWIAGLPGAIPVFGPPATRQLVAGLVAGAQPIERAPLAIGAGPVRPIAGAVAATDIAAAAQTPVEVYRDANIRVLAAPVDHYHEAEGRVSRQAVSLAFRVEAGSRTIVYSGDTGPSVGLERLAAGADLLVSEVMDRPAIAAALNGMGLPPGQAAAFLRHMDADHLTPAAVGRIAARARVGKLVLTHLVPGRDEETGGAGYTAGIHRHFTGPVVVANDGDRF